MLDQFVSASDAAKDAEYTLDTVVKKDDGSEETSQDWAAFRRGFSNECDGDICTMALWFVRPFKTASSTEDEQLDTEKNQGFDVFGTFTSISSNGTRSR